MNYSDNENNDNVNEYRTLCALRFELVKVKMKVSKKEAFHNGCQNIVQTKMNKRNNVNSSTHLNKENRIW